MGKLPEGARHVDPLAEAEYLGRHRRAPDCGTVLVDEFHAAGTDVLAVFVHITLTAEAPLSVRPDLGERIAGLVREDLREAAGG
jgi:hypothetical protein